MEKKEYPIKRLINWYFGNYCARKCFDKDERLFEHHQKLTEFAEKNSELKMTYSDFLKLFNNEMTICTLEDSFKRRMVGWRLFEILNKTPNYDSDNVVVKDGIVQTKTGLLEKPVMCGTCKFFGIH